MPKTVEPAQLCPDGGFALPSAKALLSSALLRFVAGLWSIESVKRVGYTDDGVINMWIVTLDDVDEVLDQISDLQCAFDRTVDGAPLDFHVFPLSRVNEENLPPCETLFER